MNTKATLSLISLLRISTIVILSGYLFSVPLLKHSIMNFGKSSFIKKFEKRTDFFEALAHKESSARYHKVNRFGYLGKYQFGEEALTGLGYYNKDGSVRNDWRGKWTGKYGVFSKQDFLNSPLVQEIAAHELAAAHWNIAKAYKLDKFIGKKMHGVQITKTGILAAMHLKGPKSVNNFIYHGINSTDALGTGVKKYMYLFSDCKNNILTEAYC